MEQHVDSLICKVSVSLSVHLYYQPTNLFPIIYLYTGTIGLSYHRSPNYLPSYDLATNVQRMERDTGWLLAAAPRRRDGTGKRGRRRFPSHAQASSSSYFHLLLRFLRLLLSSGNHNIQILKKKFQK